MHARQEPVAATEVGIPYIRHEAPVAQRRVGAGQHRVIVLGRTTLATKQLPRRVVEVDAETLAT
jgi:hypothetical protein